MRDRKRFDAGTALAVVAAAFTALLYVARARVPPHLARDVAQPLPVVTNWGAAASLELACGAIAAIVAYVLWSRIGIGRLSALLAALAVLCAAPLVFSSDTYAYVAYGWQALHGINPYAGGAALPPGTTGKAIAFQWPLGLPACVYGPVFVAFAAIVAANTAGLPVSAGIASLRIAACAALIACYAAARRVYGDSSAAPYIAMHPAVLWCAAEGHNDALMLGALLWSVALAARRPVAASLLALCSAGVKSVAVLGIGAVATRGTERVLWRRILPAAIIVAALPLVWSAAHAGTLPRVFYPQASAMAVGSFAAVLAGAGRWSALSAVTAAALLAAILGARALAARHAGDEQTWIYAALAAWALIPNPQPWYGLWLLAAGACAPSTPAARAAGLTALCALIRYVPDAYGPPDTAVSLALAVIAVAPLALAAVAGKRGADSSPGAASRT